MNIQTPISRASDPESSLTAEANITKSGRRQNQIDQVVEYVTDHPGSTSGEIAQGLGGDWDNVAVSRRLSDAKGLLLKQGDARKCSVKGSTMVSWWPLAGFKCLGQLQAWVMAGKTRSEREGRYNDAPDDMKPAIAGHIRTIAKIKEKAEMKRVRG